MELNISPHKNLDACRRVLGRLVNLIEVCTGRGLHAASRRHLGVRYLLVITTPRAPKFLVQGRRIGKVRNSLYNALCGAFRVTAATLDEFVIEWIPSPPNAHAILP